MPAAEVSGSTNCSATLTEQMVGGLSASGSLVITVTAVNDPPSFTAGAVVTVAEDSAAYSGAWASNMSAGPGESQPLAFTVDCSPASAALFMALPAMDASGVLTFTPGANAFGNASCTVRLTEQEAGGLSATAPLSIVITPVNDPPSFTAGPSSITVTEDSSAYAAQWASAISAGPGENDPALVFIVSCSSSAAFTMFSASPQLTNAGLLTFTPAPNAYGSSVCNLTLVDSGGLRSASQQLTVTISPVNDAPSFKLGSSPFLPANPGTFTYPNFASNISQGVNEDASPELHFPLQFKVISCTNAAIMFDGVTGQPTISAAGSLSFKLTVNPNNVERSSRCQVQLQEVGGLASTSTFMTIVQSRCQVGTAYVSQSGYCEPYTSLSIPANPGVEYALFTAESLYSGGLKWSDAQTVCSSMGRGLVKLADATQDAQLYSAVTAVTGNQYWIGLNDQAMESIYRWVSDSSLLVSANWPNGGPWLPGQPNDSKATNPSGEDCVQMAGGKWQDIDCNSLSTFICA
ncbi:hypothetical protein COO60DRAFT_848775 [Scenedesmus sp. NREL 46B-D3]|nr:hypothetical protein COO60DRAFT_848775 [Scenedesmus sp. NREL 46B-D3]